MSIKYYKGMNKIYVVRNRMVIEHVYLNRCVIKVNPYYFSNIFIVKTEITKSEYEQELLKIL